MFHVPHTQLHIIRWLNGYAIQTAVNNHILISRITTIQFQTQARCWQTNQCNKIPEMNAVRPCASRGLGAVATKSPVS
jgi:uncharacterized protein